MTSDLSLPAQQEVGGRHLVVLLVGQGLFDFFPCVAHTHHYLWEMDGEKGQSPSPGCPFHPVSLNSVCPSPLYQQIQDFFEDYSFCNKTSLLTPACSHPG